jgi:hypothetical protein
MSRLPPMRDWPIARAAVASAATAAIAATDSWRTAVVTGVATATVAMTRVRFAAHAATALLAVLALIVATGHPIAQDVRPERHHHPHHHAR